MLNLADYPSVGDIIGTGSPLVIKGGLTLNGAANLLAVNQNLPFSHVEQAWDPDDRRRRCPGYPRATDDFQLVSQASVARVGGTGPGRQVLVGTGLYQLHAYGPGGVEPAGWPKFTGGWIQATPAVGDADGDGDLDVTALTREGWSFLWEHRTSPPATTPTSEWWTFHHDERGTANYGTDARPPGHRQEPGRDRASGPAATLSWTAPGDDWLCGTAARYRVVVADGPIDEPADGRATARGARRRRAGAGRDVSGAELGDATHAAVLYRDEAGNWGHLRDIELPDRGGRSPPLATCPSSATATTTSSPARARPSGCVGVGARTSFAAWAATTA